MRYYGNNWRNKRKPFPTYCKPIFLAVAGGLRLCHNRKKKGEMLRASKRIIITSENVNRYGFRVLTDGIDLVQYGLNPIMLWMHNRAFGSKDEVFLPIGNVIELRFEDDPVLGRILTGQPMFSEKTDFAKSIYELFEEGTIRMASAGLIPTEWSENTDLLKPGQRAATLVKSVLEEISIVDIGANNNALSLALYNENHERIELSYDGENANIPLIKNPLIEKEMLKLELTAEKAAVMLGLKNIASTDEFETKVMEIVQLAQKQKTQIETLTKEKKEAEDKLADADKIQLAKDVDALLLTASSDEVRKITKDEVAYLKSNATDRAGYDALKLYLDGKAGSPTVQGALNLSAGKTTDEYAGKTWDDLDQSGKLIQLKAQNLTLFKDLFKAKYNKEYVA